jgi:hypothetical protein
MQTQPATMYLVVLHGQPQRHVRCGECQIARLLRTLLNQGYPTPSVQRNGQPLTTREIGSIVLH